MPEDNKASAEARWGQLNSPHDDFKQLARWQASITDPSLIRYWDGGQADRLLPESYNDIGGRGVNHLNNKVNQVLWPATLPFVRYEISEGELAKFLVKLNIGGPEQAAELYSLVQRALAKRETMVKQEFETSGVRPLVEEAGLHTIITGNVCLHIPVRKKEAPSLYTLDQMRVIRDYSKQVIEFVLCQSIHPSGLPAKVRKWLGSSGKSEKYNTESGVPVDEVKLYTWGKLEEDGRWYIHQEIDNELVPGTVSNIPKSKPLPYVFLTGPLRNGEHYGHSYLEASGGGKLLRNLEFFAKNYAKRTAMASRAKVRVSPGALTRPKEFMRDDRGDFFVGNQGDYEFADLGGMEGFQVTVATIDKVERALGQIFLLYDAVRRDGERVTAYENQLAMAELQAGLGTFATAIQMGQQEIAALLTARISKDLDMVAPLPDGLDKLDVVTVTGMNAMSRQVELNKEAAFIDLIKGLYGPEVVAQWIKVGDHLKALETAAGLSGETRVKSNEEVRQEAQQQQLAQVGAEVLKSQAAQQGSPQPQG